VLSKTTPSLPSTNDNVPELLAVKVLICVNAPTGIEEAEVTALMLLLLYLTNAI
jgi:hypothetical protein